MVNNPVLAQIEHLSFSVELVDVHSSNVELHGYYVEGDITYSFGDVITVTANWSVTLSESYEGIADKGFLVKYSLVPQWSFSDANARTSYGLCWPTVEEWEVWFANFLSPQSLLEDLLPHIQEPIIS